LFDTTKFKLQPKWFDIIVDGHWLVAASCPKLDEVHGTPAATHEGDVVALLHSPEALFQDSCFRKQLSQKDHS
jgi:hypothetical protein